MSELRLTRLNQLVKGREIIDGEWQLTKRHQLQYRRRGMEEEIAFTGELVAAKPTALVFRAVERSSDGDLVSRHISLRGRWEADAQNRLTFLVQREQSQEDRLVFEGGWEVAGGQEILYRYAATELKTKRRRIQTIRFQGYWDIDGQNRLVYLLDRSSDSEFRFRGAFQTASILAKEGAVRYQVGVEVDGKKRLQTITLFGKCKLSRDLSLEFQVPYRDGTVRALSFGAAYAVNSQTEISAQLTTQRGEPLGVEVILSRKFLKGSGEAFVRLRKSLEETALEGGFRFRW